MAEYYIAELSKPYLELTLNIVYDRDIQKIVN